jgi:protein involved in polysaccharide export with SLBB domain
MYITTRMTLIPASACMLALALLAPELSAQEEGSERSSVVFQSSSEPITLRPGDVLDVDVWPESGLSGSFVVDETGHLHLPFLGRTQATGIGLAELRERLRAGYEEDLKNPVISVTPRYRVGVLGEVRNPAIYTVTPAESLIELIGRAGGFSANADREGIRVMRDDEVVHVDALRAMEEGTRALSFGLRSGDQIVVPPQGTGISFRDAMTIVQTAATTWFLIDRVVQ